MGSKECSTKKHRQGTRFDCWLLGVALCSGPFVSVLRQDSDSEGEESEDDDVSYLHPDVSEFHFGVVMKGMDFLFSFPAPCSVSTRENFIKSLTRCESTT